MCLARLRQQGEMSKKPALDVNDVVVQSPNVVATEADGELVLLSLDRGRCYGMNRVGVSIWRKLAEPRRVADVVGEILAEFGATPLDAQPEALAFIEHLQREGLIAPG
jgi:hypothetical protein